jgi:hypothetical protein
VRALAAGAVVREFDFSSDDQGFVAGFADLPVDQGGGFYELVADHRAVPAELGNRKGLYISGNNRSDDLWMFWKKKITGLRPNTVYEVVLDLEMASDVPAGLVGIGGAPGESVFVKAGASMLEPGVAPDSSGWLRLNVDKGNQSTGGVAASVIGNVAKESDTSEKYARLFRDNRAAKQPVTTSADGSLWVFFGTDSGFEGGTSLYYLNLAAVLEPIGIPASTPSPTPTPTPSPTPVLPPPQPPASGGAAAPIAGGGSSQAQKPKKGGSRSKSAGAKKPAAKKPAAAKKKPAAKKPAGKKPGGAKKKK